MAEKYPSANLAEKSADDQQLSDEDGSGTSTTTSKDSSSSSSDSQVEIVRKRSAKASYISLESQKNQLAYDLYQSINRELRAVDQLVRACNPHDASDIATIDACIVEVEGKAEAITSAYAQLSKLSANKVDKNIQNHFEFFVAEVESTKTNLVLQQQRASQAAEELAQEEEDLREMREDLRQKQLLLEEEQRRFEAYMQARKQQRQQQEHVTPPRGDTLQATGAATVDQQGLTPRVPKPQLPVGQTSILNRLNLDSPGAPSRHSAHSMISESESSIRQLADNITQSIRMTKKTEIEPDVFSGNPLEFDDWQCDFDSYLESMGVDHGSEKMRYLKKYVAGAARECLSGQFLIRTEESYQQARKRLSERFGNKHDVSRSMRDKLQKWPKIPPNDATALQKYADYLENCRIGMLNIPGLTILNDPQVNEQLVAVLPDWARRKWAGKVFQALRANQQYPLFQDYTAFVNEEAAVQSLPLLQNQAKPSSQQKRPSTNTVRTLATSTTPPHKCLFCDANHSTAQCFKLGDLPYSERATFFQEKKLCYGCGEPGHSIGNCVKRKNITCKRCKKPGHLTVLHKRREDWEATKMDTSPVQPATTERMTATKQDLHQTASRESQEVHKASNKTTKSTPKGARLYNMGMPVYVSTADDPEHEILVYAFMDSGSDSSYITQDLAEQLKPRVLKSTVIDMETMSGDTKKTEVTIYGGINIRGFYQGTAKLKSAYEWPHIPNSTGEFAHKENVHNYPHLNAISDSLPPPLDLDVGILIGANCPTATFPLEAIRGKEDQPYAVRTGLGWMAYGVEDETHLRIRALMTKAHHAMNLDDTMEPRMSQEDYSFLEMMHHETTRTDQGSYQMPLPFRTRPALPNNYNQALSRFEKLEQRFKREQGLKEEYTAFMKEIIDDGLAEKVNDLHVPSTPGEQWYIPHFSVRHAQKGKIRVVFDCKAQFQNTSLNDHLLQGPDMINSLLGILCRFRKETVAISCDIQKMFYNFLVDPKDRDYLRFLWYDQEGQTQTYRMKVHLFGARSSPAVATYGLRKIANDYKHISEDAATFICTNFYVDDGIISVASEEEAIKLIQDSRTICQQGNLRLHKFCSNNTNVLSTIPESERTIQDVDLFTESLPEQRTLGLQWSMATDTFKFVNKLSSKPATRRGILSVVSQLYDPLGFIAPYTLLGKNLLQQVNKSNIEWDEEVSPELKHQWTNWLDQLPDLEEISIPRCIKPEDFGNIMRSELHHFCDASDKGIGACSYLRITNKDGRVHTTLLLGKSKVIPSKGVMTTPRLELMAAVLATELSETLLTELDIPIAAHYYWTDSKIVLGWLSNHTDRYERFVHNRVRAILSRTEVQQWHHVPGASNPADIASRGLPCAKLKESIWFSGPTFLSAAQIELLQQERDYSQSLDPEDSELKRIKVVKTSSKAQAPLIGRYSKYSAWTSLQRAIANLQQMARHKRWDKHSASLEDIRRAQQKIITDVQLHHFADELKLLRQESKVSIKSALRKLDPFIDTQGMLRVGGRAQCSSILTYEERHPVILPREDHVSQLIVRHFHEMQHHQGRASTQAAIRTSGFWIVGSTRLVKSILHQCTTCRRIRGKPGSQKMAPLPSERLEPSPPFTHVGIDCFGPFTVKDRRSELKRWGLLITCLYSRAVHVELLNDLSTDSVLNALRCFICLRGPIQTIFCDNGTNFVGACNVLAKELEATDPSTPLGKFFRANQITFKFNAPHASHAGGVWERQIRSIRAILDGMSTRFNGRLNTEALRTALYEAMATVNSRPIWTDNLTDPDTNVITPGHLLTSKPVGVPPPPGQFESDELYGRVMWRKVQQFSDEFWAAWKSEYLQDITKRQRWETPQHNLQVGDVVMLVDEAVPRNQWSYGRVVEATPGLDGLVRRVKVQLANPSMTKAKIRSEPVVLERPVQKVVEIHSSRM